MTATSKSRVQGRCGLAEPKILEIPKHLSGITPLWYRCIRVKSGEQFAQRTTTLSPLTYAPQKCNIVEVSFLHPPLSPLIFFPLSHIRPTTTFKGCWELREIWIRFLFLERYCIIPCLTVSLLFSTPLSCFCFVYQSDFIMLYLLGLQGLSHFIRHYTVPFIIIILNK